MSSPTTNTKVLPFAATVSEVAEAIQRQVNRAEASKQEKLRNHIWCEWLKSEVLS